MPVMRNQSSSDSEPSAIRNLMLKWIVGAVVLLILYFGAGPWIVLFLCACNEDFMNSGHPLGKGLEWSMYPAIMLADNFELYGDYFWDVLAPLGG